MAGTRSSGGPRMRIKTLTMLAILCGSIAFAQAHGDAKYGKSAESAARQRRGRIRTLIRFLPGHCWAGHYYTGDGLGVNVSLDLAPGAGYVFELHGCLGLYDRNFGAVSQTGETLR